MKPLVSINCATFNHEGYIAKAIEGFLMQKTTFDFEILIGEDCSTDKTREIVEKYVRRFPNKVKLITSHENVGAAQNFFRLFQNSKGKYIALCEGDDYWLDSLKLQKQVDYMEQHPDCTLCFHNGEVLDSSTDKTTRKVIPWMTNNEKYYRKENAKYSAGELALLGYIPTASYLYPKHLLYNLPDWCFHSVVGDNVIKLITASHGYAYYIDEVMSVYRFGVPGSATTNWVNDHNTVKRHIKLCQGFIELFDNFNHYSNLRFEREIDEAKKFFEFQISLAKGEWKEIRENRYVNIFRELDTSVKLATYIRCNFPQVYKLLKNFRTALVR
ncbi:glycosyltransferase [Cytobacillus sp.]|uniref:glycosyltransferase n=1 Tax=Cytobacillus sp. TaxID=2675269 RepID=UPI0028BDD729|nr:glycosyltransferase [Cytobacillus sp.]